MFVNRPGQNPEERFSEIEKTLSLDNLVGTEILTSFPEATDKTGFFVVDDSGSRYLVITGKGLRFHAQLTAF